jgi:hypothetical protein
MEEMEPSGASWARVAATRERIVEAARNKLFIFIEIHSMIK